MFCGQRNLYTMFCPDCQRELLPNGRCPQCAGKRRVAVSPWLGVCLILGLSIVLVVGMLVYAAINPGGHRAGWHETPERARQHLVGCMNNQRQIAIALNMYAHDHRDTYPADATVWADLQLPHAVGICPSAPEYSTGYGYNTAMSRRDISAISNPASAVLSADTIAGSPLSSLTNIDSMRHGEEGFVVGYVDGHASYLRSTAGMVLK